MGWGEVGSEAPGLEKEEGVREGRGGGLGWPPVHCGDWGSHSGLGGQRQGFGAGVTELLWLLSGGQTC